MTTKTMRTNFITKALEATLDELANVTTCDNCGCIIEDGEEYTTHDGRTVCNDCADNMVTCEWCGDLVDEECIVTVYDECGNPSEYFCEDCAAERAYYCEDCGRWVTDWAWDDERGICRECAEEKFGGLILPYHSGHPDGLQFFGESDFSFIRGYFGRELEVTTSRPESVAYRLHNECDDSLFHIESDCSVDGFEIIFQPMTLEYMATREADIRRLFAILNEEGATAEEGNGLHVHVSRFAFGADPTTQARRIALCMKAFAGDNYLTMIDAAGRDFDDALQWSANAGGIGSFKEKKQAAATRRAGRYYAVNVQNFATVEFRLGRSTVCYDDFMKWTQVIGYIVRRSETITPEQASDFDHWFGGAPESLRNWLANRGAPVREPLKPIDANRYNAIIERLGRRIARNVFACVDITEDISARRVVRHICDLTEMEERVIFGERDD